MLQNNFTSGGAFLSMNISRSFVTAIQPAPVLVSYALWSSSLCASCIRWTLLSPNSMRWFLSSVLNPVLYTFFIHCILLLQILSSFLCLLLSNSPVGFCMEHRLVCKYEYWRYLTVHTKTLCCRHIPQYFFWCIFERYHETNVSMLHIPVNCYSYWFHQSVHFHVSANV